MYEILPLKRQTATVAWLRLSDITANDFAFLCIISAVCDKDGYYVRNKNHEMHFLFKFIIIIYSINLKRKYNSLVLITHIYHDARSI